MDEELEQADVDHWSVSKVNMALRCLKQFEFRYIKGLKLPANGHLLLGGSFHKAQEYNYKQKIETKKDLKMTEVLDAYNEAFENPEGEVDWGDEQPETLKDLGYGLVEMYHTEVAPKTQPVMVEKEFLINVPGITAPLKGFIDLVDSKEWIRDSKTAGRKPDESCAQNSLQLKVYALGYRSTTGKKEKRVALDYSIKTKVPKFEQFDTTLTDKDVAESIETISLVARATGTGLYYPCGEGNWWCSEKWCGYWKLCKGR